MCKMCIIFFSWKQEDHKLLLFANRDEFYQRPALALHRWENGILAGRDSKGGGTWLGYANGRVAALTNFRDPEAINSPLIDAPSRGNLVVEFLLSDAPAQSWLEDLEGHNYNGFNLIAGDGDQLCWYTNRGNHLRLLPPGFYGLSNGLLDESWPKIQKGKQAFQALKNPEDEALMNILTDESKPPDHLLPSTGLSQEAERLVSSVFITSPLYGTRCSTILRQDINGQGYLLERTWSDGNPREIRLSL